MIIDLQRRARELGRIRIGQVVQASNGKTRPAKLDRFRITAHSRDLIEKIANLYGGDPTAWQPQGGGPAGFEVVTTSTRLPILVPPQPISQFYELWTRGGCERRCDGVRELRGDVPCICGPDPAQRECKPTTRLNVVLREVEGIGVFRLETKGYYAAVELPMAAELLAQAGGYISGYLGLEERVVKRDRETRRFQVPTIDVDITPGQLLAGGGGTAAQVGGPQSAAVESGERPALAAGQPQPDTGGKPVPTDEQRDILTQQARDCVTLAGLKQLWRDIAAAFYLDKGDPLVAALTTRAAEFAQQPAAAPAVEAGEDPNTVWLQVLQSVPEEWTTEQVENDFAACTHVSVETATAADMHSYLHELPERVKAGA